MRYLFLLILLAGCDGSPNLAEVDRDQNYQAPEDFDVEVRVADSELVFNALCGDVGVIAACVKQMNPELYAITMKPGIGPKERKANLAHELEHVAYGFCHEGEGC